MENFLTNIWVEVYLKVFFGRDVSSHTFGGFVHFFLWRLLSKIASDRLLFREFVVDMFRPIFFWYRFY